MYDQIYLVKLLNCLAKSDRVSKYLKWVRLVRVRKKIKTQTRNPPRETTTWRVACGVEVGGWYRVTLGLYPSQLGPGQGRPRQLRLELGLGLWRV